ncbi:MAG: tetratricopeptide repeat protein, partial [Brevinematia bacterium]
FCLGRAYYETGQIGLAIDNLKKAESYATKDDELMVIYTFLGINYEKKGDLDNSLFYHSKSLNLAKKLGDRKQEAHELNNIAIIFYKKGELDKALEYYEESLRLKTNEKDKAPTYNNIANIYVNKGDYKRAIEYYKKAIEIDERYGDYHGSGRVC